ncbi:hypothetical protein EIP91_011994 [Steccherinum ochraceum]|uniref:Uncharacterized protein n=1 Tax=Steccherinum ochraceum TaxID=92696 RepID=A0A4R0RKU0_9APHY|nr:hypothetical protein EIP91_011994 [Steccherinum ochraceum]
MLSNSQNAQRAKQEAQVEAEHAKVKDDAEWEIPQAMREQWGIASSPKSSSSRSAAVSYESSYVPFMSADSSPQAGPSQVKGRRRFNTHGEEVASVETTTEPQEPATHDDGSLSSKQPPRAGISGFKAPLSITKDKTTKRTKTAQMLIREDNGKGLRDPPPLSKNSVVAAATTTTTTTTSTTATTGFRKPAGIDVPTGPAQGKVDARTKRSREQGSAGISGSKEGKKRKKAKAETTL